MTRQDTRIDELARRAVVEETACSGPVRLEVFAPGPTDATFVRERNVAPESIAAPMWSTAGTATVALTTTSISIRFWPLDATALAQRPAGPSRVLAADGSWDVVKGYGGLPQAADEVLIDGALLTCRTNVTAPVAFTRIVLAGAAWPADERVDGGRVLAVPLGAVVANHHDKRMALAVHRNLTHSEIADLARAAGFVSGGETPVICVERYAEGAQLVATEHRRWTPRVSWSPHSPFTGVPAAVQARAFAALASALATSNGDAFPLRRIVDQIATSYNVRDIHFAAQLLAIAIVTAAAHGYDLALSPSDRARYERVRVELLERGYFHEPGYESGRPQKDIKFLRDIADAIVLRSCGFSGTYYGSEHVTTLELAAKRERIEMAIDLEGKRETRRRHKIDYVHTGPGTLAGRYMRTFWHPVYRSEDLSVGHAKPVKILNADFTLYRDEHGVAHAVGFRCTHRGSQLSVGFIEGDCIRCFYHGWKFNPKGECVERPAEKQPPTANLNIPGYPTQEYLGLIFVYFGEGEPRPLWSFKAMEREGIRDVTVDVMPANFFFSLENSALHFNYVHRDLMEEKGIRGIPTVRAEETPFGLSAYFRWPNQTRDTVAHKIMPNVGYIVPLAVNMAKGVSHSIHVSFRVPVDDASHTTFRVTLIPVTGAEKERILERRSKTFDDRAGISELADAVLAGKMRLQDIKDRTHIEFIQDYIAQVGQGPVETRDDEHLASSDVEEALFRRIWRRELTALADGKPLTPWRLTAELEPT